MSAGTEPQQPTPHNVEVKDANCDRSSSDSTSSTCISELEQGVRDVAFEHVAPQGVTQQLGLHEGDHRNRWLRFADLGDSCFGTNSLARGSGAGAVVLRQRIPIILAERDAWVGWTQGALRGIMTKTLFQCSRALLSLKDKLPPAPQPFPNVQNIRRITPDA